MTTYTGRPRINTARDLPAAVHPSVDIWIITPHGDEDLVQTAARDGDDIAITVGIAWDPSRHFRIPADSPITTRVY
jgi:hypothetical protein